MSKVAISEEELTDKVLAAVQAHRGCELVKEIGITSVHIIGTGMTWHANLIDCGSADPQLAANAVRRATDTLEPAFTLIPRIGEEQQ